MAKPKCPDMRWLVGRRITDIQMGYAPKDPARSGEWYVHSLTLDDGSVVMFDVLSRDDAEYVQLLKRGE
jgi:hypothetical protein